MAILRRKPKGSTTGDGRPILSHTVHGAEASWSKDGEIHAFCDSQDGHRLIWDMSPHEAHRLMVALQVCLGNVPPSPETQAP